MKCIKCKHEMLLADERSYYDYNIEGKEGFVQEWWCENEKCEIDKIQLYIEENATL